MGNALEARRGVNDVKPRQNSGTFVKEGEVHIPTKCKIRHQLSENANWWNPQQNVRFAPAVNLPKPPPPTHTHNPALKVRKNIEADFPSVDFTLDPPQILSKFTQLPGVPRALCQFSLHCTLDGELRRQRVNKDRFLPVKEVQNITSPMGFNQRHENSSILGSRTNRPEDGIEILAREMRLCVQLRTLKTWHIASSPFSARCRCPRAKMTFFGGRHCASYKLKLAEYRRPELRVNL